MNFPGCECYCCYHNYYHYFCSYNYDAYHYYINHDYDYCYEHWNCSNYSLFLLL